VPGEDRAKLKQLNGVESASAGREKGQVVVKYDDSKVRLLTWTRRVADSGFSVRK